MATRRRRNISSRGSFRDDPQLQQYFLDEINPTGKVLGVGSYGSVVEVEYQHTTCAAKQMHELLVDPGNQGLQDVIQKYQRECQLMASVRHPNVTQFLGLCFVGDARLPLLVMERLEMSLDDLLECAPNLSLPLKLSTLCDTCSGLVYLHSRQPSIVHRDITARNILITSSMSAKITDFGCSRMIDTRPGQLVKTLSKLPGTLVYMPPEALNESHKYGPSLDVFSFGHLTLYTVTQVFPGELLSFTYPDPNNKEHTIGRSELERRQPYITILETQVAQSHPVLLELVRQCLHNAPERRPSGVDILKRLKQVKVQVEGEYGDITKQLDIGKIIVLKKLKMKESMIEEMQIAQERLEAEKQQLLTEKETLHGEKTQLERIRDQLQAQKDLVEAEKCQLEREKIIEKDQYETEKIQLENVKKRLETEKDELELQKHQLEDDLSNMRKQLERSNKLLEDKDQQLQVKNDERKILVNAPHVQRTARLSSVATRLLSMEPPPQTPAELKEDYQVTFSLQLDWRCGPDIPFSMHDHIQSVEVEGTVYVGGGWTRRKEDRHTVMAYNPQSYNWHALPPYSAEAFAMTTINNKLVLVGGWHNLSAVDRLGVWQTDNNQWTYPFPPMPTPHNLPSATSYKHWLVVAGGSSSVPLSTVEVLDVHNKQWSTGPSTPAPWRSMMSTRIGDTWYLMGGKCGGKGTVDVYSASLDSLVSRLMPNNLPKKAVWNKISGHKHYYYSSPLNIGGTLLAAGGCHNHTTSVSSSIHRYVPETGEWVVAGNLPCGLYSCTCTVISDRLYVFGGFDGKKDVSSTYYCSFTRK